MDLKYRSAAFSYKIRVIAKDPMGGDVYGLTIPRHIAILFSGSHLFPSISGNSIILQSGIENGALKVKEC